MSEINSVRLFAAIELNRDILEGLATVSDSLRNAGVRLKNVSKRANFERS